MRISQRIYARDFFVIRKTSQGYNERIIKSFKIVGNFCESKSSKRNVLLSTERTKLTKLFIDSRRYFNEIMKSRFINSIFFIDEIKPITQFEIHRLTLIYNRWTNLKIHYPKFKIDSKFNPFHSNSSRFAETTITTRRRVYKARIK